MKGVENKSLRAIVLHVETLNPFFRHPGGSAVLLNFNGRDGTAAFVRTGHSAKARELLTSMVVAEMSGTIPKGPAQRPAVSSTNATEHGVKRVLLPIPSLPEADQAPDARVS